MNFTRPFCQNHGVTLPSYVYAIPSYQTWKNHEANKYFDAIRRLGFSKIGSILSLDVTTIKKCVPFFFRYLCHAYFPSCDQTQSTFLKQEVCRESCFKLIEICGKFYEVLSTFPATRFPKLKNKYRCKVQPYRNAGDSPECYYLNGLSNYTGKMTSMDRWHMHCIGD